MEKLISMTDFLPEHPYSKFLKQPLKLWMFVPCDDDGNFLELPSINEQDTWLWVQYKQAKERCLFDGCVYDDEMEVVRSQDGESIFYVPQKKLWNIESAIQYNLQLTQTAIKQIGI